MDRAGERLPGKLVAVEGLDGSGKSTQVYLLFRWLESRGCRVFFTEWNSSLLVREATRKGKRRQLLTPTTFSLIHATDFADRYERQILPLLRAGYIVLCDRYMFTSFARDAVRGCDPAWLRRMYGFARVPDITFFFRLPLEVALGRILEGRPKLRRKLGLAAAEELQATRGLLRETGEAVLVRLDAELAAMASYLRGEELEGERPRLPSPRTLAAMVNACRALKVKPKKGRVKDLARIEALLKALSAMMPPEA